MKLSRIWKNVRRFAKGEPLVSEGEIDGLLLTKLINKENPVILEIGCNDGTHTKWFLDMFHKANIFCFEPDPRACERFRDSVNDDRVKLFKIAISDQDGEMEFYMSNGIPPTDAAKSIMKEWDLSGSLKKPKIHLEKHPWCKFDKVIKVNTMKLDSWAKQHNIKEIDFIWADVQGAEAELISGAKATLKNTKYFYTEYNDLELYEGQETLKQLLEKLPNFKVVKRYRNDILLRNRSI